MLGAFKRSRCAGYARTRFDAGACVPCMRARTASGSCSRCCSFINAQSHALLGPDTMSITIHQPSRYPPPRNAPRNYRLCRAPTHGPRPACTTDGHARPPAPHANDTTRRAATARAGGTQAPQPASTRSPLPQPRPQHAVCAGAAVQRSCAAGSNSNSNSSLTPQPKPTAGDWLRGAERKQGGGGGGPSASHLVFSEVRPP